MKFVAALGWLLAMASSPALAVVVIEPGATAVARQSPTGPAVAGTRSLPQWNSYQMALVIPALIVSIGLFGAGKQRSPRSVVA